MSAPTSCPVAFCRAEAGHRTPHDIRACTRDCGPILDGKPRAWHAKDCPNGAWLTRLAERQAELDAERCDCGNCDINGCHQDTLREDAAWIGSSPATHQDAHGSRGSVSRVAAPPAPSLTRADTSWPTASKTASTGPSDTPTGATSETGSAGRTPFGSTCLGHFPACPHTEDVIACDTCIRERKQKGLLYCADLNRCGGPGCMDHLASPVRDPSQTSTGVDDLPADRAVSPSAPSSEVEL